MTVNAISFADCCLVLALSPFVKHNTLQNNKQIYICILLLPHHQ